MFGTFFANDVGYLQNKGMMEMNGNGHHTPLKPRSNGSGVSILAMRHTSCQPRKRVLSIALEACTFVAVLTFAEGSALESAGVWHYIETTGKRPAARWGVQGPSNHWLWVMAGRIQQRGVR